MLDSTIKVQLWDDEKRALGKILNKLREEDLYSSELLFIPIDVKHIPEIEREGTHHNLLYPDDLLDECHEMAEVEEEPAQPGKVRRSSASDPYETFRRKYKLATGIDFDHEFFGFLRKVGLRPMDVIIGWKEAYFLGEGDFDAMSLFYHHNPGVSVYDTNQQKYRGPFRKGSEVYEFLDKTSEGRKKAHIGVFRFDIQETDPDLYT